MYTASSGWRPQPGRCHASRLSWSPRLRFQLGWVTKPRSGQVSHRMRRAGRRQPRKKEIAVLSYAPPSGPRYRIGLLLGAGSTSSGRAAQRKTTGDLGSEGEDLLIGCSRDLIPVEDASGLEVGILADPQTRTHPLAEVDLHAVDVHLSVLDHAVDHDHRPLPHPIHSAAVGHEFESKSPQLGTAQLCT